MSTSPEGRNERGGTLFEVIREKLAPQFVATVPTRLLYTGSFVRKVSRKFWWTEIVKELARRGEVESVRLVTKDDRA
jgi:hypothetical protein